MPQGSSQVVPSTRAELLRQVLAAKYLEIKQNKERCLKKIGRGGGSIHLMKPTERKNIFMSFAFETAPKILATNLSVSESNVEIY